MKREFLTGELGLSKAVTDKIMAQHGQSVSNLKEKLDRLEKENADYVSQMETLKNNADELLTLRENLDAATNDMEALKNERDGLKEKLYGVELEHEIGKVLAGIGAKNLKAAGALIDRTAIEKTEEGYVGIREQAERVKNECGYLFHDGIIASGMRHAPAAQNTDSFTQFARAGAKLN